MEKLFQYSALRVSNVTTNFKRYLYEKINWKNRLIFISGARGVGKTTLLLQYIKENLSKQPDSAIYVSLDDLYFSSNTLVDFADNFVKHGGKYLFIDEVHKYDQWAREIKNIYDVFTDLHLVITGSSALDIFSGSADLSRRAMSYTLPGLSFREFLQLKYSHELPLLSINDIFSAPADFTRAINEKIKPIKLFEEYLQIGYYPFFLEDEKEFAQRLKQTVNQVVESDLPAIERINFTAVQNLKKLLAVITEISPFKPNILKLSKQIGVSRETLQKYLYLLSKADLLLLLQSDIRGISRMNKPEKIYLNNPNLIYALTDRAINKGTLRETFAFNQLQTLYQVTSSTKGDFTINQKYTIEVGGKNKKQKQIAGVKDAFVVSDNIEFAHHNVIPLWLFGFLY